MDVELFTLFKQYHDESLNNFKKDLIDNIIKLLNLNKETEKTHVCGYKRTQGRGYCKRLCIGSSCTYHKKYIPEDKTNNTYLCDVAQNVNKVKKDDKINILLNEKKIYGDILNDNEIKIKSDKSCHMKLHDNDKSTQKCLQLKFNDNNNNVIKKDHNGDILEKILIPDESGDVNLCDDIKKDYNNVDYNENILVTSDHFLNKSTQKCLPNIYNYYVNNFKKTSSMRKNINNNIDFSSELDIKLKLNMLDKNGHINSHEKDKHKNTYSQILNNSKINKKLKKKKYLTEYKKFCNFIINTANFDENIINLVNYEKNKFLDKYSILGILKELEENFNIIEVNTYNKDSKDNIEIIIMYCKILYSCIYDGNYQIKEYLHLVKSFSNIIN